jgi:UDP-N-acetylmuramoyl-L-alanyl-D-glutamate--2,6-diaminopimelate ligase
MKLLRDLLYKVSIERVQGDTGLAIDAVSFDSRKCGRHHLFVAVSGTQVNGHHFIATALEKGAIALLVEEWQEGLPAHIAQIQVKSTAKALGIVAANFYNNPSESMQVVAVTGTNGKTTFASLMQALAMAMDRKAGLLSTVVNKIGHQAVEATHTTPDPLQIQSLMRKMADEGCRYVFMEASSHGIVQERIAGIRLKGAVFTNLSRDHLDYHGSMEAYIQAKKKLFDELPSAAFALTNSDDRHGRTMVLGTKAKVKTYALKTPADFNGRILESDFGGMLLRFNDDEFWTTLIGTFNAYNLLAIYAAAEMLQLGDRQQLLSAMSLLKPVAGRFQYVKGGAQLTGIVDYAHTPDALENVCATIKDVIQKGQRLLIVVGCGGDRDKGKRPEMARIAARYANKCVFTSDNPRSEDPEAILDDMESGLNMVERSQVLRITDRREAIKTACHLAQAGDVILIAGKGHETYQEIKGVKHPFDDLQVLRETLDKLST